MNSQIVAAVNDMFFAARIRGTAEQLGIDVEFPRNAEAVFEAAMSKLPGLIIFDLHAQRYGDIFALAERIKADEKLCAVPLLGFFSHVQTELHQRAKRAGLDHVLARSAFTKRLPEILRGNI